MGIQLNSSPDQHLTSNQENTPSRCPLTSALPQVFLRQEASFAEPNFGCQCNSYIFRDENGQVHGNCRSTRNGAQWCFVNPGSSCQDTGPSPFGRPWSYEACATPSRG